MFCHFYNQPQGNTFKGFRKTCVLEEGTTEGEVMRAASRPEDNVGRNCLGEDTTYDFCLRRNLSVFK